MSVVCSSVKDAVINNGSELSPGVFAIPDGRHSGGVFSRPSRDICSREPITAGDTNTLLTTTTPSRHTDTAYRCRYSIYRCILRLRRYNLPVRRMGDCVPSVRVSWE